MQTTDAAEASPKVELNFDPTEAVTAFSSSTMRLRHTYMVKDDAEKRNGPPDGAPDIMLSFVNKDKTQVVDVYVRQRVTNGQLLTELHAVCVFRDGKVEFRKDTYSRDTNSNPSRMLDRWLFTADVDYTAFVDDCLGRSSNGVMRAQPRKTGGGVKRRK